MKHYYLLFVVGVLVISFFGGTARAETPQLIDLSTGIAFPSNNSAIPQNPAALARFQNTIFDLSTPVDSGNFPSPLGSLSAGMGHFGLGLDVERIHDDFNFTGAFAAGTGNFSMGINATRTAQNSTPTFNLGLRQELQSYAVALMIRDLAHLLKDWTFGLGIPIGQSQRFGFDFNFMNKNNDDFGITNASITGSWMYYTTQKFAFQIQYTVSIVPDVVTDKDSLGGGVNLWVGQKISLYGLYHERGHTGTVGLKFLL